jgi:hypothetical protein
MRNTACSLQALPPEVQERFVDAFKKMPKWQRDLTIQGFK